MMTTLLPQRANYNLGGMTSEPEPQTGLAVPRASNVANEIRTLADASDYNSIRFFNWSQLLNTLCVVGTLVIFALLLTGHGYSGFHNQWTAIATVAGIFAGSIVAGFAGFAFSAIAGGALLHWLTPQVAVPLLLSCSITTQLVSLARLWNTIEWRRCVRFIAGGLIGIPIGAFVLENLSSRAFAVAFGCVLVAYSGYSLFRPHVFIKKPPQFLDLVIGFLGGITGGSSAFPGAFPTVWCNACGVQKNIQRGIVQPYILVAQIATLAYFSKLGLLTAGTAAIYFWCAPLVLSGTWLGLNFFRRASDAFFRRVVLILLLGSGISLII